MRKEMKPGNCYILVNIDEEYATEVFEIVKKGEEKKGTWPEGNVEFVDWIFDIFGEDGLKAANIK